MNATTIHAARPGPGGLAGLARLSIPCLALLAGCAASERAAVAPGGSGAGGADSAQMVLEVRLRRSAELADSKGALRVFDQDLSVEYRARGAGPGHEAGEVTFDGRPMRKVVGGKGAVSYRLGREEPEGGAQAGAEPWSTIANTGGPGIAAAAARVKLAPFPLVTRPAPGLGVLRSEELAVVMLPPVPDVWYRVSLTGAGPGVLASDLGDGRWLFPLGSLDSLSTGRARILIEVETSCGSCRGPGVLRINWSSRSELEIPVTLL